MSEEQYTMRGRDIYSSRGKLVATLDADGNPVWAPGMAGAHSKKLAEWLGEKRYETRLRDASPRQGGERREESASSSAEASTYAEVTADETAGQGAREDEEPVVKEYLTTEGTTTVYVGQIPAAAAEGGEPEEEPKGEETVEEYSISTIPEEELPPFSREYGVNTPGFMDFVKKYKLNSAQVAALVKRLETK